MLTKNRLVMRKNSSMLVERGSSAVKQETCFNSTAISSQLGVGKLTGASLSSASSPGVWPTEVVSCIRQATFSTKELTANYWSVPTAFDGGTDAIEASGTDTL